MQYIRKVGTLVHDTVQLLQLMLVSSFQREDCPCTDIDTLEELQSAVQVTVPMQPLAAGPPLCPTVHSILS